MSHLACLLDATGSQLWGKTKNVLVHNTDAGSPCQQNSATELQVELDGENRALNISAPQKRPPQSSPGSGRVEQNPYLFRAGSDLESGKADRQRWEHQEVQYG
jgi:hypothetical protein